MLSADRVVGYLAHPLGPVRGLAEMYLIDARPRVDADAIWRAAEHGPRGPSHAAWLSLHARQSRASLEKLASALHSEREMHVLYSDLLSIGEARQLLELLPSTPLTTHWIHRIRYRCALRALAPGEVWQQLTATAGTLGEGTTDVDADIALWPLAEAAATHRSLAPRLLAGLTGDSFWLKHACILAVGVAGLVEAIPLLIDLRLGDYDLIEELDGALCGMPAEAVLAELRAHHERSRIWTFAPGVIGKLHTPAAEHLLCELLDSERDPEPRSWIARTLCENGTTVGLTALKRLVPDVDYDEDTADLAYTLPALELMQATSPAEVRRLEGTIIEHARLRGWSLAD